MSLVIGWLLVLAVASAASALHRHSLVVVGAVWLAWLIGRVSAWVEATR